MAGLIEGRYAVTHELGMDVLDATGVHPVPARVVDDGDLVSAGGVISGLDVGLHILEREFGPRVAHAVETLFEYERRGIVWRNTGRTPITIQKEEAIVPAILGTWDINLKSRSAP
jgi:transcriptional regulator GlxA family with amidase domain